MQQLVYLITTKLAAIFKENNEAQYLIMYEQRSFQA